MKYRIIGLLACVCAVFQLSAQSFRHDQEVFVGVGTVPGLELIGFNTVQNIDANTWHYTPVLSAGYKYYLGSKVALGATVAMHSFHQEFENPYTFYYESNFYDAVSLACEVKAIYINKKHFQFYGNYGLGVTYVKGRHTLSPYMSYKTSRAPVNICIMPIGFRIGGDVLAFFAEAGICYKGCLNAGVQMRVAHKKQYDPGKKK